VLSQDFRRAGHKVASIEAKRAVLLDPN